MTLKRRFSQILIRIIDNSLEFDFDVEFYRKVSDISKRFFVRYDNDDEFRNQFEKKRVHVDDVVGMIDLSLKMKRSSLKICIQYLAFRRVILLSWSSFTGEEYQVIYQIYIDSYLCVCHCHCRVVDCGGRRDRVLHDNFWWLGLKKNYIEYNRKVQFILCRKKLYSSRKKFNLFYRFYADSWLDTIRSKIIKTLIMI